MSSLPSPQDTPTVAVHHLGGFFKKKLFILPFWFVFPSLTHSQFPVSPSVLACPPSSLPQPSLRASPFCPDQCWRAVHLLPQHGLLGGWRDSGFKSAQPQGGQSVELWSWLGFQAEQPWAAACAAVSGWRLLPDSPSRWCPWPSAYCGLAQGPRFTSATPLGEKKQ